MLPDRTAAGTLIVGAILFLIAAFAPISRVFGVSDPVRKLEIITGAPTQWMVAQVFFALGALVNVGGVGLLAYRAAGQSHAVHLAAATALMAVGAVLWTWHLWLRATDPAMFTAREVPFWLIAGYSLATLVGLALIGFALLHAGLPAWLGRFTIGAAAVFLILALVFGDMPPFVYYGVTLTIGIVILRATSAAQSVAAVTGGVAPGGG